MNIPKLRSPIVLVHGLMGFDKIGALGTTLFNYFPGIPELMTAGGNRVLIPHLSATKGVDARAQELKEFILKNSPHEPVHVFGHSMGGLDSRYMISCLDMSDKVLTLTTLGTPHRGTSFADWGVSTLGRVVRPMLDMLGMPSQAFYDLTRASCKVFNEKVKDAPGVRYFSVAGRHDGHLLHPEWLLSHGIIMKEEGENDGLVSVASASYGEQFDLWEADHAQLVNWFHPVIHLRGAWKDPAPRYGALLRRLADSGY